MVAVQMKQKNGNYMILGHHNYYKQWQNPSNRQLKCVKSHGPRVVCSVYKGFGHLQASFAYKTATEHALHNFITLVILASKLSNNDFLFQLLKKYVFNPNCNNLGSNNAFAECHILDCISTSSKQHNRISKTSLLIQNQPDFFKCY